MDVVGIALSLSGQFQSFGSRTQNVDLLDDIGPDQTIAGMQNKLHKQQIISQAATVQWLDARGLSPSKSNAV